MPPAIVFGRALDYNEATANYATEACAGPDFPVRLPQQTGGKQMEHPVLQTIKARRSVRRFLPGQVEEAALIQILEAGRWAPSGGNSQTSRFFVMQNAQVLEDLRRLVQSAFSSMEAAPGLYQSIRASIAQAKRGGYDFCYGAPTLVVAANRRDYGNALADCACALENMMLAASALNVGSCWINQLHWLDTHPLVRPYLLELGLGEDETVCGGLALGYAAEEPAPPARKGNNVIRL